MSNLGAFDLNEPQLDLGKKEQTFCKSAPKT